jgi:hypothetical protein
MDILNQIMLQARIATVRFGSLAVPRLDITSTAASGTIPVVRRGNFPVQTVSVCFYQEQSFRSLNLVGFEGQLTAKSGRSTQATNTTL